MHEVPETLPPGAVIRSRYLVIDLLGKGGFSAVYLVQDLQSEESFFALKEAITAHRKTSEHFTFEYSLLERLLHPALPRVHRVFDDEEQNRSYMLMDYVEGPNLETLRHIQHEKRFAFPVITSILAPIVDAIGYLHQQNPAIVHRDIKPSNMIVPITGGKTVLVDFGIAKEFEKQGTTSAVRYGSHGYGAPEQYTTGTNTRTDIYGLGATLYTLLTGEIAPDALDRMTEISNDRPDPLQPASELVPSIPPTASMAIQRAMSINMMQRFASVQEFWQAFQGESGQQPHIAEALDSIGASPSSAVVSGKPGAPSSQTSQVKKLTGRRSRKRFLLPVFLTLLLIIGIGASFWGFTVFRMNQAATTTASHSSGTPQFSTATPMTHPTLAASMTFTPNTDLHLAPSYSGPIADLQANVLSQMALTRIVQKNGLISGSFNGLNRSGTFSGFLDASKNIYFLVSTSSGSLSFTGTVQKNGEIEGQYCASNRGVQCISNGVFGWWSVAPPP
jgi:serine/threonine protein kinase